MASVWIILPVAWLVGLRWFGTKQTRLALWSAPFVVFYGAFVFAVHHGAYTLTVQVLDPQKKRLPDVTVDYFSRPDGDTLGRFAWQLDGPAKTDSDGRVVLHPNHAQSVTFEIRDPRFGYARFQIEGAGSRYGHQIIPDNSVTFIEPAEPPPATGTFHGTWVFEAQPEHRITVALKTK